MFPGPQTCLTPDWPRPICRDSKTSTSLAYCALWPTGHVQWEGAALAHEPHRAGFFTCTTSRHNFMPSGIKAMTRRSCGSSRPTIKAVSLARLALVRGVGAGDSVGPQSVRRGTCGRKCADGYGSGRRTDHPCAATTRNPEAAAAICAQRLLPMMSLTTTITAAAALPGKAVVP